MCVQYDVNDNKSSIITQSLINSWAIHARGIAAYSITSVHKVRECCVNVAGLVHARTRNYLDNFQNPTTKFKLLLTPSGAIQ